MAKRQRLEHGGREINERGWAGERKARRARKGSKLEHICKYGERKDLRVCETYEATVMTPQLRLVDTMDDSRALSQWYECMFVQDVAVAFGYEML
jgi:hypothetical protein